MNKAIKILLYIMIIILLGTVTVSASIFPAPYQSFTYNAYDNRTTSPNTYLPELSVTGQTLGIDKFNKPADLCVGPDNKVYISDTLNNRIVVLNSDFSLNRVISKIGNNGKSEELSQPNGLFVNQNDQLLIADTGNRRVIILDVKDILLKEIKQPKTENWPENIEFEPLKLAQDSGGTIYIQCKHVYQGLVQLDSEYQFSKYFGTAQLISTADIVFEMMLRMIMTKKQISQRQSFQPIEYTNININKRDFIYATSVGGEKTAPVAKINPAGSNILNSQIKYGDDKNSSKHYFTGIVEDKDEFFYVADNQTGLIFQYDQKSDLIAAFGGIGDRLGLFQNPIDIDIAGDRLLVLDSEKENLTIFIPTEYQKQISEALNYYKLGKYSQSIVPWQKVLQLNTNFATAYVGIGNALYMKGEFRQAMNYFELGNEKELYSRAKQANRTQVLIKNFTSLMISVILLIILLSLLSKNRIKVKTWIRKKLNTKNNFGG